MVAPARITAAAARVLPSARARAINLLTTVQYTHPPNCPCHGNPAHHQNYNHATAQSTAINLLTNSLNSVCRSYATPTSVTPTKEYAFEMAASSIRFGPGCTKEVGMDFANMNAGKGVGKVLVCTDKTIKELPLMMEVAQALDRARVKWEVYTRCRSEPKDYSVKEAIEFGKKVNADAYLAVGGGSVMDTAKIVNLYNCYPEADLMDFVNAPLGKGLPINKALKPLICIPTTAGTGSETTGIAIFDIVSKKVKTGIAHRALKPTLGIIDPLNTATLHSAVHASAGLDVLCHSLESYTAIPFSSRAFAPSGNPLDRPAYQGANPISDVFSLTALRMAATYLPRAVHDPEDAEARLKMLLAATLAGVGFGNAGVHLCHGMSYPISGMNPKDYKHPGYAVEHPLIPHGVSVAVTAPAVFKFTAPSSPRRHLEAAECFGVDVSNAREEDAGEILSDALKRFLEKLGDQPRGLKALGFERGDVKGLVDGTVPQRRVLVLAPGLDEVVERQREELSGLFEEAMEY
ncbi:iron-containing alcohol dehydrogenase-domain containing protein [Kalaharituber pfeilii]|nr:iron-containing alcohol dehydrogenase-domain containing protein [Kalaharituber pfeilii]